jgi:hypothetical protein
VGKRARQFRSNVLGLAVLLALVLGLGGSAYAVTIANSAAPSGPAGGEPSATSPRGGSAYAADGRIVAFRAALQSDGFMVRDGQTGLANPLSLVDHRYIDSAAGNNKGQFYKRIDVPPFSEDAVRRLEDPFRLKPYEAIVYLGPTPPRVDYFSFTPFLYVRHYKTPPVRDWLMAALGDPLNNARIKTEDGAGPFNANTMVIFTADRGIYQRIAAAAKAAGYPASMVNLYTIPSSVLHMGTSVGSDTFVIIIRTANFKDEAVGRRYLLDRHWANVFRITPRTVPARHPLPQPPWRARDWRPEENVVPGIENALKRLRKAIVAQTPHETARRFGSKRWWYDSKDVLIDDPSLPAYRQFVAGESSDTPYLRTSSDGDPVHFKLGRHDRAVVYGVNHAATGLATYTTFGVYGDWRINTCEHQVPRYVFGCGDPIWNGVSSMTNHDYRGSAKRYLPHSPLARYLYAVTVVRRKGECPAGRDDPHCLKVPRPSEPRPYPPSADGIGLKYPLMIGYRAYLNPHTRSGASYGDIIHDRSILFR